MLMLLPSMWSSRSPYIEETLFLGCTASGGEISAEGTVDDGAEA